MRVLLVVGFVIALILIVALVSWLISTSFTTRQR